MLLVERIGFVSFVTEEYDPSADFVAICVACDKIDSYTCSVPNLLTLKPVD